MVKDDNEATATAVTKCLVLQFGLLGENSLLVVVERFALELLSLNNSSKVEFPETFINVKEQRKMKMKR